MAEKETYKQMKDRHRKEISEFPCFFAFTQKQFEKGMKELGVENKDELRGGFCGMVYRASDEDRLVAMLTGHAKEVKDGYKDDDFLYSAFRYEMENHEFCITHEPEDTLDALGLSRSEVERSKRMVRIWNKAEKAYLDSVIW
ncbi:hypothetical protein SAMN02745671_01139 [Anaerovibrio lipolyticus DSM 3074]|uniref:Uncharacterized protein n=1 Tax=Anaerovibrio lipolyticus DSM 3074 TaxID=1120997 RepID=A0A1M6CJB1_9FIRM|nr:hypothetical protein [Anaerovibrio lipolyticus]SHI61086.1 hypothetical protein SAMN02745671_01139 [Anaerovibrio lipolyticus DSM 3074]